MHEIELDAANWTTVHDFYDALLSGIGAPEWHGRNINALVDSMIWGGINDLGPPYTICIRGTARLPRDVQAHIELAKNALLKGRAEFHIRRGRDIDVNFEMLA